MWLTARTRTGIRPSRTVAGARFAAPLVALVLAGCASPVFAPGGSTPPASVETGRPLDRIHRQAQDALVRWADAVRGSGGASITFVGELTSQVGDWEAAVGDNNKMALMTGRVAAAIDLPTDSPGRREVKWLDGSKVDVNVLSAADTFQALVTGAAGECDECTPLRITEANLATGLVETSRGPAEAPVWVYTIAGTQVRVTRVAVDESVTIDPPAWNADDPPVGVSIDRAIGAADSRDLEVAFIGAKEDASKPCGVDYTAEAVESELAVVVIVHERRNPAPVACTLAGFERTATVRLEARLGDRVVLEVKQGLPVPVLAP